MISVCQYLVAENCALFEVTWSKLEHVTCIKIDDQLVETHHTARPFYLLDDGDDVYTMTIWA